MAKIKYSSGPITNQTTGPYPEPIYASVRVTIENNSKHRKARIKLKLYDLTGERTLVKKKVFKVGTKKTRSKKFNVANFDQFEVRAVAIQRGSIKKVERKILVNAVGRDAAGNFVSDIPMPIVSEM